MRIWINSLIWNQVDFTLVLDFELNCPYFFQKFEISERWFLYLSKTSIFFRKINLKWIEFWKVENKHSEVFNEFIDIFIISQELWSNRIRMISKIYDSNKELLKYRQIKNKHPWLNGCIFRRNKNFNFSFGWKNSNQNQLF